MVKNVIEIFYDEIIMDAKNVNFCKPINVRAKFTILNSMQSTDSLWSLWLYFWKKFVHFHETKSNVNNDAFEDIFNGIVWKLKKDIIGNWTRWSMNDFHLSLIIMIIIISDKPGLDHLLSDILAKEVMFIVYG